MDADKRAINQADAEADSPTRMVSSRKVGNAPVHGSLLDLLGYARS